jgi:cytochrome c1
MLLQAMADTRRWLLCVALSLFLTEALGFIACPPPRPTCVRLRAVDGEGGMEGWSRRGGRAVAGVLGRVGLLLWPILGVEEAWAANQRGVKLFEENCISCHVGGGNIIG